MSEYMLWGKRGDDPLKDRRKKAKEAFDARRAFAERIRRINLARYVRKLIQMKHQDEG